MHANSPLSIIRVTGDDAKTFLQGQLTQDVAVWPNAHTVRRAAWCNVKGRIWATFYVWQTPQGFDLLLAQDMAEKTLKRLKMYVLRAKVAIEMANDEIFFGETELPPLSINDEDVVSLLTVASKHYGIRIGAPLPATLSWDAAHIQAGIAWISAASSEQFVPQAVNYELVGGINFKKGCYSGQEIVARSQYLGKLRRRAAIVKTDGAHLALLSDVVSTLEPNPVGSVVLSAPGWALIECQQALIENQADLSVDGQMLTVQALPYPILDITQ